MKKSILLIVSGIFAISASSFAAPAKLELKRILCNYESEGYAPMHMTFSEGYLGDYLHLGTTISDDSEMPLLTTMISSEIKNDALIITSDDGKVSIKIPTTVRKASWNTGVTAKAIIKDVGNIENYTFNCRYNNS